MSYTDELRKHIVNIMDSYCIFYDNRSEKNTEGKLIPSIYDNAHQEEFNRMLGKVAECVCSYMKVDYDSLTFEDYASVKATLEIKNQYRLMCNKLAEPQLLRYLGIFYRSCYEFSPKDEMPEKNIEEFKKIYLESRLDEYFNKYVMKSIRISELQQKFENKTSTFEDTVEYERLEEEMANSYKDLDLVFLQSSKTFDKIIANKEDTIVDRSYAKLLINREIMRLMNPMRNSTSWKILLDRYTKIGDTVDLDKANAIQHEIGFLNGRIALLGDINVEENINKPTIITALEEDNANTIKMFDTYFNAYEEGYNKYHEYLRTTKNI